MKSKWERIKTLKGYFRITGSQKNKKGSATISIILNLPNKMRFELLSPSGTAEIIVVSDGSSVEVYYPGDKIMLYGPATNENIKKILGIDLQPEEMVPIIIGTGVDLSQKPVYAQQEGDSLLIHYYSVNNSYEIILNVALDKYYVDSLKILSLKNKEMFAEVKYLNFTHREVSSYPGAISLDFPVYNTHYKIKMMNAGYSVDDVDPEFFYIKDVEILKMYHLDQVKIKGTILFGE